MTFVTIDYETRSACDLKKCGVWVYSEHPSTDVTFLGYSFNGGEPKLWKAGNFLTGEFSDDPPEDLFKFIRDEDPYVVAHNAQFEKAIWSNVSEPRYHWPKRPTKWIDTMAVCARKTLPLALERAARILRLNAQKNMSGANMLKDIMKPRKIPKSAVRQLDGRTYKYVDSKKRPVNFIVDEYCEEGFGWDVSPWKYKIVGGYCLDDIRAEDCLLDKIGTLSKTEQAVWELDQIINERGITIDQNYVSACEEIIDQAIIPLTEEFRIITGGINPTQREKFRGWLRGRLPETYDLAVDLMPPEEQLPNMQKETLTDFAEREDLPEDVDRLMEIYGDLTSTSIKKIEAMRRTTCKDGRARGLLQYHAASPGRWGGRLLQPQNFPRGTVKSKGGPDELVADIMKRNARDLKKKYGSAIQAVSTSLRHGLIARPGHKLVVADFASIEARTVLAIAGQLDVIEKMKNPEYDIYNDMASLIFGKPILRKAVDENDNLIFPVEGQVGKNTVLGCGFQMGPPRFKEQVKTQTGLIIPLSMAQSAVQTYRTDFAPKVKALWSALDEAAMRAVWDRSTEEAFGIVYQLEDAWLTARIPSGRKLYYFDPQPCKRAMPWDDTDIRPGWTYWQMKKGVWKKIYAYGGLLTENVVQGTARDIMVDRMFAAEFELSFPILLTSHDELITEVPDALADHKLLEARMEDAPQWALDLNIPVKAEGWTGERYRK